MKRKFLIIIGALFFNSAHAGFGLDCYEPVRNYMFHTTTQIYIVDVGGGKEAYVEEYSAKNNHTRAYPLKRIKTTEDEYTYYRVYVDQFGGESHFEYTVSRKANYIKLHRYQKPNDKNYNATKKHMMIVVHKCPLLTWSVLSIRLKKMSKNVFRERRKENNKKLNGTELNFNS